MAYAREKCTTAHYNDVIMALEHNGKTLMNAVHVSMFVLQGGITYKKDKLTYFYNLEVLASSLMYNEMPNE
jgi:hypothetical protein